MTDPARLSEEELKAIQACDDVAGYTCEVPRLKGHIAWQDELYQSACSVATYLANQQAAEIARLTAENSSLNEKLLQMIAKHTTACEAERDRLRAELTIRTRA